MKSRNFKIVDAMLGELPDFIICVIDTIYVASSSAQSMTHYTTPVGAIEYIQSVVPADDETCYYIEVKVAERLIPSQQPDSVWYFFDAYMLRLDRPDHIEHAIYFINKSCKLEKYRPTKPTKHLKSNDL